MWVVSAQAGYSHPPSKLKDIEERSRQLRDKFVLLRYLDSVEDSKDVSGLLEDIREAVGDYMVRP